MEPEEPADHPNYQGSTDISNEQESRSAVNSLILDYYKKFGRKRDLEQYFSLSTAQSDIRDPSSLFWRRMKMQNDSSDSGEKPSESSTELCRISIKCSIPVESSSQDEKTDPKVANLSDSPPIITEEEKDKQDEEDIMRHSDDESVKSEDNHSQKSADVTLDTSMNKPLSPTSSINSQRKLEWDSLADVGYANEGDRKTSGSSLSTLERLALLQQYSNSDNKNNNEFGPPTAHSTLIEPDKKSKTNKKGLIKSSREFRSKDVDVVEFNLPPTLNQPPQSINVNLTKHISFNVEKDASISGENIDKEVKVGSSEKYQEPIVTVVTPELKFDKEIQTSLIKSNRDRRKSRYSVRRPKKQCVPVFISLNTLRRRLRKRKTGSAREKTQKYPNSRKNVPMINEKSGEQVSEAESFEYMPGHIYNQNQMNDGQQKARNSVGNKSSLESSGGITTGSSNTNASFTKDLEKSVQLLDAVLKRRHDNSNLKKSIVKEVVQKLLQKRYRDDDSTTDFLSGLSLSSKRLGLGDGDTKNYTTTSTSDGNNSEDKIKRPRKSILRMDKFNPNVVASTSQSAPNLPAATSTEMHILSKYVKSAASSHTESDISSKTKDSSDTDGRPTKTSSEELYLKYREAIKREEAYKNHLRSKEIFMRQKLLSSGNKQQVPIENDKLKDIIKDLTRNNYDDGSGDASKLEGSFCSNKDIENFVDIRKQRSHSVFTLSSGTSEKKSNAKDKETRKINLRKRLQQEIEASCSTKADSGNINKCCCPHKSGKCISVCDSAVQLKIHNIQNDNLNSKTNKGCKYESADPTLVVSDNTGDIKYVYCVCSGKNSATDVTENVTIYKCSRLNDKGVQLEAGSLNEAAVQCCNSEQNTGNIIPCSTIKKAEINPKNIHKINDIYCTERESFSKNYSEVSQPYIPKNITHGSRLRDRIYVGCLASGIKTSPRKESVFSPRCKDKIYVHEITRCINTEISIDPKIPDPSLSDVNIISNTDCATVVSEKLREISLNTKENGNERVCVKKHSDTQISPRADIKFHELPQQKPNQTISCQTEALNSLCDIPTQCDLLLEQTVSCQTINENLDNCTVPVHGTNLTLLVTFDKENKNNIGLYSDSKVTTQGISTDGIQVIEKSTCLQEECTKSAQIVIDKPEIPSSSPITNISFNRDKKKDCYIVPCLGSPAFNFDTYPKTEKKSYVRTSTDTELLKKTGNDENLNNIYTCHEKSQEKSVVFSCNEQPQCSRQIQKNDTSKSNSENLKSSNQNTSSGKSDDFESSETSGSSKDPILVAINNITERYAKNSKTKTKKKKCFAEIMQLLKLLLETEEVQTKVTNLQSSGDEITGDFNKLSACDCYTNDNNGKALSASSYIMIQHQNMKQTNLPCISKVNSCTTSCETDPNMKSLEEAIPQEDKKDLDKNNSLGTCKSVTTKQSHIMSISQPNRTDQKCSNTSLVKNGSDLNSKDTTPKCTNRDMHVCSSCGNNLSTKRLKNSNTKDNDECECGCGGRGECKKRIHNSRVSQYAAQRKPHSPSKTNPINRDIDGRHERNSVSPPTKNMKDRKTPCSSCDDNNRGSKKVGSRDKNCKCGCAERGECKRKPSVCKSHDAKSSPSPCSTDRSSKYSSPRDIGGYGEGIKKPVSAKPNINKNTKFFLSGVDRASNTECSCGCGKKADCKRQCESKKKNSDKRNCSSGRSPDRSEIESNKKNMYLKKTDNKNRDCSSGRSKSPVRSEVESNKKISCAKNTEECSCGCGKKHDCKRRCESKRPNNKKRDCSSGRSLSPDRSETDSNKKKSDAKRTDNKKRDCSSGRSQSSDRSEAESNKKPSSRTTTEECYCGCGKKTCLNECVSKKTNTKNRDCSSGKTESIERSEAESEKKTDCSTKSESKKTNTKNRDCSSDRGESPESSEAGFKKNPVSITQSETKKTNTKKHDCSSGISESTEKSEPGTKKKNSCTNTTKECKCGCGKKADCISKCASKKTNTKMRDCSSVRSESSETSEVGSKKKSGCTSSGEIDKSSKCDKACQCGCDKGDCANRRTKWKKESRLSAGYFISNLVDKSMQMSCDEKEVKVTCLTDSSLPRSSSHHESSDIATCDILNRIKRECDKYQKRCKSCHHKCGIYSSTSENCDNCKIHSTCHSKTKCRGMKPKSTFEKLNRNCVAYNLILQTSESMMTEEANTCYKGKPQLKNVIVKVPPRCQNMYDRIPYKVTTNCEDFCQRPSRHVYKTQEAKLGRSSSVPNESEFSSTDDYKRAQALTCRDYLERNRPDFIERTADRQNCLKIINETSRVNPCATPNVNMVCVNGSKCYCLDNCDMFCGGVTIPYDCARIIETCLPACAMTAIGETFKRHLTGFHLRLGVRFPILLNADWIVFRATERDAQRELLLLELQTGAPLNSISATDISHLARKLGLQFRDKKLAPKFISEREMKEHSQKIYKTLPEVVKKKEELKKESIKKTNLLMANIFKRISEQKYTQENGKFSQELFMIIGVVIAILFLVKNLYRTDSESSTKDS